MWTTLIRDLLDTGLSEKEIAEKIGSTQPSINRIRNGKQTPGFQTGTALLRLKDSLSHPAKRRLTDDADKEHAA